MCQLKIDFLIHYTEVKCTRTHAAISQCCLNNSFSIPRSNSIDHVFLTLYNSRNAFVPRVSLPVLRLVAIQAAFPLRTVCIIHLDGGGGGGE
jgi:hypothetical protein